MTQRTRFCGGLLVTAGLLAAQHWFPWWKPPGRLACYTLGTSAILVGQAVYLGPRNRKFWQLATFPAIGGLLVYGAYLYDWAANRWARIRAKGDTGDGRNQRL